MVNLLKYLFLFLILVISISCEKQEDKKNDKIIGITNREFSDSLRSNWTGTGPRPLRVLIWYPAAKGDTDEIVGVAANNIIRLKDADISSRHNRYPLILLSHGSGQQASQMFWLGSHLALNGYVAVSVNHNGNAEEERKKGSQTLTDFCFWERPQDLSTVLDFILKDPFFAGKIDTQKIGAAGFSLGGATVIMAAGARLNLDSLRKNSPPPSPQIRNEIDRFIEFTKTDPIVKRSVSKAGNSFKDKRIKAVFVLAPAVGGGFTKEGLRGVNIPLMIAVGDKDLVTPAETNAKRYAEFISNAELIILPGEAGHFITERSESKREEIMENVCGLARNFFNEKLEISN